MKGTLLNENDNKLPETTLLKYGRTVSVEDLMRIFRDQYSEVTAHNRIHLLANLRWLKRINMLKSFKCPKFNNTPPDFINLY